MVIETPQSAVGDALIGKAIGHYTPGDTSSPR